MQAFPTIKPPCICALGFLPSIEAREAFKRWRQEGYNDVCVWKGFEIAVARHIERSYAIPCTASVTVVPELFRQIEALLPSMIPPINIAQIFNHDMSNSYMRVRCRGWKMLLEVVDI